MAKNKKQNILRVISANTAKMTPEEEWEEFAAMAKNMGLKVTQADKEKFLAKLAEENKQA